MSTTYKLISKNLLTSNTATVSLTNIPSTYTDLLVVISARSNAVNQTGFTMRINQDTGTNYGTRRLYGTGSSAVSDSYTLSAAYIGLINGTDTTNTFNSVELYFPNYAGSTNKSWISSSVNEKLATNTHIVATANSWSSTSAINSFSFSADNGDIVAGSSFFIYGIKNSDDNNPSISSQGIFGIQASGGDEVYTTGNGYKVHVFKNSGTLNVTAPGEVEYLVIAGGGGGGSWVSYGGAAGGGGAGGYLTGNRYLTTNQYPVVIGAGGSGGVGANNFPVVYATNGSNSIFSIISAVGGGQGTNSSGGSADGGSGGGQQCNGGAGGLGIPGQGNNGGAGGPASGNFTGGGGGGAGSVGGPGITNSAGNGGSGLSSSITGTSITRAGGGGGGAWGNAGSGGTGGGGNGATGSNSGISGSLNTGSGGGGTHWGTGGAGGSGIVIIRYRI